MRLIAVGVRVTRGGEVLAAQASLNARSHTRDSLCLPLSAMASVTLDGLVVKGPDGNIGDKDAADILFAQLESQWHRAWCGPRRRLGLCLQMGERLQHRRVRTRCAPSGAA